VAVSSASPGAAAKVQGGDEPLELLREIRDALRQLADRREAGA